MTLAFAPERIEHWPLTRLQPYAKNAKVHGAEQVAKLAASMAEFGWTVPCLVAEDGELIAGHGQSCVLTICPPRLPLMMGWLDRWRKKRLLFKEEAQCLASMEPVRCYYLAQEAATVARLRGDRASFWHWAKTAAGITRINPRAEMDMAELERPVASAEARETRGSKPGAT